jgi:hypothetical protein
MTPPRRDLGADTTVAAPTDRPVGPGGESVPNRRQPPADESLDEAQGPVGESTSNRRQPAPEHMYLPAADPPVDVAGTAQAALEVLEARLDTMVGTLERVSRDIDALTHRLDRDLDAVPGGEDLGGWLHRTARRPGAQA